MKGLLAREPTNLNYSISSQLYNNQAEIIMELL
jgi:hypothetical protein